MANILHDLGIVLAQIEEAVIEEAHLEIAQLETAEPETVRLPFVRRGVFAALIYLGPKLLLLVM